jgi:hypothetical protein
MLRYKIDIDEIIDNNADVGGDDFDCVDHHDQSFLLISISSQRSQRSN